MNQKAYKKLFMVRLLNFILISGFMSILVIGCKDDEEPATVKDIDGNVYKTIKIGSQVWMAENLRVTRYRNGDPIPFVNNTSTWGGLTSGAYCYPNNDHANVEEYGILYNGYAVSDSRNIAPAGWHIPADSEWQQLIDFLGEEAYQKFQQGDGFSAKRAGSHYAYDADYGGYLGFGIWANWWTATGAKYSLLHTSVSIHTYYKNSGYSVRCVKD
jgi:uncharacterized protein (TIGR02145 family)